MKLTADQLAKIRLHLEDALSVDEYAGDVLALLDDREELLEMIRDRNRSLFWNTGARWPMPE